MRRDLAPREQAAFRMNEITNDLKLWSRCCSKLWADYFTSTGSDSSDFCIAEKSLLEVIILSNLGIGDDVFWEGLYASYVAPPPQQRQFCKQQRSGNIYCQPRNVSLSAQLKLKVKSIDNAGTMLDGVPYAELEYEDGFLLEPLESLTFDLLRR